MVFGPDASEAIKGKLIKVVGALESSILAFSAASLRRWRAVLSSVRSIPSFSLKSATSQSTIKASKSSPPR